MEPWFLSVIVVFCFMSLLYMVALVKQNNGVADIGWGLGFILVTGFTLQYSGTLYPKQRLLMFLVTLWGIRLAAYIAIRNWGKPEDFRYAQWRKEWGARVVLRSFLQVFMLQGLIMLVMCIPIILVNSTPRTVDLKWFYPIGALVWTIGFFTESIADHQMFFFKENVAHKGRVMDKGLWRYSRHPNYFGEMLVWWGIFLISVPSGYWYISIVSPVLITFLLLRVSGVTMLEKKYDGNDEYSQYKQRTNAFVPWFPKQT